MSKSRDIADSAATINYIDGLTSDAQTQLDGKATLDGSPTFTGTVTATAFSGDGSGLTGVDSLPSQTGQSGKFLTTDGLVASWDAVDVSSEITGTLPVANGGTGATTLTANNVLLGNGTSAPLTVAPSTAGNVLTSDGTTWQSVAPAGGGAWELLHTTTITTLSSFITITSPFSSTYDTYAIHFDGLDSTNTSPVDFEFWLRKGGANKLTNYAQTFWSSDSGTISTTTSGSQGFIIGLMGNASWSGNKTSGFVIINSANTTNSRSQLFQSQITFPPPSGIADVKFLLGNQGDSGAIDGFTLNIGSGDFKAGTIKVYGLKKS